MTSCAGARSTRIDADYDTRQGDKQLREKSAKVRFGESPMMRYYLPTPYIQVYAYEVRLLGRETLRIGFRPVSVPDLEQAYLVDHTYGMFFEDRLQVTTSPEGLLEYVGYRRVPKQVEAAATAARMALSFAAPLPGPLKGEDGLPEFSRLVYRKNFRVEDLFQKPREFFEVGSRKFELSARMLSLSANIPQDVTNRVLDVEARGQKAEFPKVPKERFVQKGFLHRPLMPLEVSIQECKRETNGVVTEVTTSSELARSVTVSSTDGQKREILTLTPVDRSTALLTRHEAAIQLSEIVYCANPWEVDTFFVPGAIFAKQSFELRLAGGSLYDARVSRDSEVMGLLGGIGDVAGGALRIPAQLFTFTVVHEDATGGGEGSGVGGDKAPRRYIHAEDKAPRRYLHAEDKD